MRTTININNVLLDRLKNTAEMFNISTNALIALLINTAIAKDILNIEHNKSVRYQDADPDKNWSRFHVTFDSFMYEKGLDLRRFFKPSVSLIISLAIVLFLDELIEQFINTKKKNIWMDNYPANYIFIAKLYNGIKGFTILWGIPDEKHLKELVP